MFISLNAYASQPINFDRGYSEIDQKVQEAAQKATVIDCLISVGAKIQKYEKTVDYVDQGLVDIIHKFFIYTYEHGKRLVTVYEPMYPNYNDKISSTCTRIK